MKGIAGASNRLGTIEERILEPVWCSGARDRPSCS